jgi:hypothetical protein
MPDPVLIAHQSSITSNFTAVSDTWLPAKSIFTFSDNTWGRTYETLFFAEFEQGAKKIEDCKVACGHQKYLLQAHYYAVFEKK